MKLHLIMMYLLDYILGTTQKSSSNSFKKIVENNSSTLYILIGKILHTNLFKRTKHKTNSIFS